MTGSFREIDTLDSKLDEVSDEQVSSQDRQSVSDLIAKVFQEIAIGAGYSREQVDAFISKMTANDMKKYLNYAFTVLYEEDGRLVACGVLSSGGIVNIYKGRQSKVIGSDILGKLEVKACDLGLERLYVDVADFRPFVDALKKLGYNENPPIDYSFGTTNIRFIVMEKELTGKKVEVIGQIDLS